MKTLSLLALCLLVAACTPAQPPPAQIPADSQPTLNVQYPYEFVGITQWFNTEPLTRKELQGKVVLVDIWTYSCINCVRTLPYLTSWDEKYRDEGLVIVGIHSPEFDFEKNPANVRKAIEKHGIEYPVGMDNDYATWKNYRNSYWPHTFLFDRNGELVFDHIGEGNYDELEAKIQDLLEVEMDMTEVESPQFGRIGTPEIYLGGGSSRGNTGYNLTRGAHMFTRPADLQPNTVYLEGVWSVQDEHIFPVMNSTLTLQYKSKAIYVVAGGKGMLNITVDGVPEQYVNVDGDGLYMLADTEYGAHLIQIQPPFGTKFYTFTFG